MSGSAVIVSVRVSTDPKRAFDVFTSDIGLWWKPSSLFRLTDIGDGRLEFLSGEGGSLISHLPDGRQFQVGRIIVWEPGHLLVFEWKPESFAPDHMTEVHVRFEAIKHETRVTVEHRGWDAIPTDHAARHGFPLMLFQHRAAEHWHKSLMQLSTEIGE